MADLGALGALKMRYSPISRMKIKKKYSKENSCLKQAEVFGDAY